MGQCAHFAMRHVFHIQNAARHQYQAGVHLTLRFRYGAARIGNPQAVNVKEIFVEIGFLRVRRPAPDAPFSSLVI